MERARGLATLTMYTAGSGEADASIPGLAAERATLAQRWFGLVELKIETAGSSEAEVELSLLGRAEADALKRTLFGARETSPQAASPPQDLVRDVRARHLLLAGVTETRFGVILAALSLGAARPQETKISWQTLLALGGSFCL